MPPDRSLQPRSGSERVAGPSGDRVVVEVAVDGVVAVLAVDDVLAAVTGSIRSLRIFTN